MVHKRKNKQVKHKANSPQKLSIKWVSGRKHPSAVFVDCDKLKQIQKHLENSLDFEKLLTDISVGFISLPSDRIDDGIKAAQKKVCEFLNIEYCHEC
jgi:hypothetical protein